MDPTPSVADPPPSEQESDHNPSVEDHPPSEQKSHHTPSVEDPPPSDQKSDHTPSVEDPPPSEQKSDHTPSVEDPPPSEQKSDHTPSVEDPPPSEQKSHHTPSVEDPPPSEQKSDHTPSVEDPPPSEQKSDHTPSVEDPPPSEQKSDHTPSEECPPSSEQKSDQTLSEEDPPPSELKIVHAPSEEDPPPSEQKGDHTLSEEDPPPSEQKSVHTPSVEDPPPSEQKSHHTLSDEDPPPSEQKGDHTLSEEDPPPSEQKSVHALSEEDPPPSEQKSVHALSEECPPPREQKSDLTPSEEDPPSSEQKSDHTLSKEDPVSSEQKSDHTLSEEDPPSSEQKIDHTLSKEDPPPLLKGRVSTPLQKRTLLLVNRRVTTPVQKRTLFSKEQNSSPNTSTKDSDFQFNILNNLEQLLFTFLQTNTIKKISSTSGTFQARTSGPAHSEFPKDPAIKDYLNDANLPPTGRIEGLPSEQKSELTPPAINPVHPPIHTERVEGPPDGGPYPSDSREDGRTGVSSAQEDLVVSAVCQDNEHQDQVVMTVHLTSSDTSSAFFQPFPPPPTPGEGGCRVLLSNVPEFSEGERVPCPSRVVRSMQRVRHGRGFPLYHKNRAFTAEETATPMDQLEVWSGLDHRNVLELSAALGDCDGHPETSYQLTRVYTGDLKSLMRKCHLPSLRACLSSLFSDRVDLILWNVKYILREILEGLEYLHSVKRIVHGNLKLQNILVDIRCNCEDIFQCPHKRDSKYRVYISDFDQAVHIGEGEDTEWDDVFSFGLLLMEIFGITKVDECTAVERECVGLEGLYDVVSACLEINSEDIPRAADLLKHSFFSLHPPGGVCDSTPPPWSPPDSCAVEDSSPPLAVQAQQEPHEEGCKQVLGYKTPEQLAHLLTSKHSQSTVQTDLSQSDVVEVVHSKEPSPILNHNSSVSSVDSGSKDRVNVRPTQHDSQIMNKHPNNTSEERDALMAELKAKRIAEKGIVTQSHSGAVVYSRCGDFPRGSSAPLPSKEAISAFIGKGGNGIVSYVYHNGKEFAVKETCLRDDELLTLSKLSHRNVMEISAVIEGERHERYHGGRACYQLMPRVTGDVKKMMEDGGIPTLCHYFFQFKTESDKASYVLGNAKFILREALSGLQYLHNIGVVHRDVKLQNILVDVRCNCEDIFQCPHEGDSGYRVYISDFDSVLDVERTRKRLERRSEMRLPVRYGVHGTPGYIPPEACYYCSSNEVIPSYLSTSQDIWSFGCTLMKFFVGSSGPSTQKELSSVKLSHCLQRQLQPGFVTGVQFPLLEKYFSLATEPHYITQGCLKVDPTQRPTVEEILKHPFLKPHNGDSPSRQEDELGKPTACASDGHKKPSPLTVHLRPDSSHSQCSAVESNSGQGQTSSAESCCKVAGPDGSVRDYHQYPKKKQQPGYITESPPSVRHSLTVGEKEMKKFLKVSLLEKYFPLATELHDIIQGCLKVKLTQHKDQQLRRY